MYSPYQRQWIQILNSKLEYYLEDCPVPGPNPSSVRTSDKFSALFDEPIPKHIPGYELETLDQKAMELSWPAGEDAALEVNKCNVRNLCRLTHAQMLRRFLRTKSRSSQLGAVDPLASGAEESDKHSRIGQYKDSRDRGDLDSTSRIR